MADCKDAGVLWERLMSIKPVNVAELSRMATDEEAAAQLVIARDHLLESVQDALEQRVRTLNGS